MFDFVFLFINLKKKKNFKFAFHLKLTRSPAAANMERKLHPNTLTGDSGNPWDFVLKMDRVCNH